MLVSSKYSKGHPEVLVDITTLIHLDPAFFLEFSETGMSTNTPGFSCMAAALGKGKKVWTSLCEDC